MPSNQLPIRERTVSIDKQIRKKAATAARGAFHRMSGNLLADGHANAWSKDYSYEDFQDLRRALDKFCESVHVPMAEDRAIREFLSTYEKLQAEFPHLAGDEG